MSKYRIHRVTDKDKAFNDLLDEAGYGGAAFLYHPYKDKVDGTA